MISDSIYNEMIDTFKGEMSKRQQEEFVKDILLMEYPKEVREKFIGCLENEGIAQEQ